jgi:hypothetical protein
MPGPKASKAPKPTPLRQTAAGGKTLGLNDYLRKILTARVYDVAIETSLELARNLSKRVHNQVLLAYDILPVNILAIKSSLLVPPLLAVAYSLLGWVLPRLLEKVLGPGGISTPINIPPRRRAGIAVASTVAIIKASELLTLSPLPATTSVAILTACCACQWAALDGAWASLVLACAAAIGGPLAELPLIGAGCWHYLSPDYFPLSGPPFDLGAGTWAGLSSITGPCYFAVTTDAIALGRWLGDGSRSTEEE